MKKPLLPEDGALKFAMGYHSALRGKPITDNPYDPWKGNKPCNFDGSDLLWAYGFMTAKGNTDNFS